MSFSVNRDNWQTEVQNTVNHFKQVKRYGGSMYSECMWQYRDMARASRGGAPTGDRQADHPELQLPGAA